MINGVEQKRNAAQTNGYGQPVDAFDQVVASSTLSYGFLTVFVSKDKSNARFGPRGVARSDNFPSFQSSSPVVGWVMLPGIESIGSWGSPSRELGFFYDNRERIFGYEVIGSEPTNLDVSEWIMNLDTFLGEDHLRVDHKNPEDGHGSQAVDDSHVSFEGHSGVVERSCSEAADENNQSKVSPVSSGAINVFVGHNGQNTTSSTKVSK